MQGYSPKLPLIRDNLDGSYSMNKTAIDSINQDLKMLVLTNPGERMMIPDYGVGLRALLFSQNTSNLENVIINRIQQQLDRYMRFINLIDISINTSELNENMLNVSIKYSVPSLNSIQEINLSLGSN